MKLIVQCAVWKLPVILTALFSLPFLASLYSFPSLNYERLQKWSTRKNKEVH